MMKNVCRSFKIILPLLLLGVLILQTCTAQMGGNEMASIKIIAPENGSQIAAGNITVSVNVMNFNLVNKLGEANVAGEGHIHYFMDVSIPTAPGKPALSAPGTYAPIYNESFVWQNVTPGMHNFSAELVNNDHTPLVPPVTDEVSVEVLGNDPPSAVVDLVAKNVAYNTSTITVPAGADVTVNFDNQDANIPHNFAVYDTSAAKTAIFQGKIITGPGKITYNFTAPDKPGTYFFRCDVHPTIMTGQFIVT